MLFLSDFFTKLAQQLDLGDELCRVITGAPLTVALNTVNSQAASAWIFYTFYDADFLNSGWNKTSGKTQANPYTAVKAWRWQQCTELGWFKTPNTIYPLTSLLIDDAWWGTYCKRLFGEQIKPLNTAIAANRYGQLDLQAKNVLFVSETLDPYSDLSFKTPNAQ